MRSKPLKPRLAAALTLILALALPLCLSACGSSSSQSVAHVQGSSASISTPMLNHWMRAMAGGDFRAVIGTKGPVGLVSEPANYSECAVAAKKVIRRSYAGQLSLSDAQIEQKCHELHSVIKEQALSFLLSVAWTVIEGEEAGIRVSEAELQRQFARYKKEVFKDSEAYERKYLEERHWVLSDVLYQLKRNILVTDLLPRFEAKVKQAGGGEKTYTRLALERYHSLIGRTSCTAGYVVRVCRGYRAPAGEPPSPNQILEAFVQGIAS